MSGDYSRLTDRTRKRFSSLLMQQGRVHLDSDWNELVAQVARRAQLQSLDTFGPAAVPVTTKNGFFLTMVGLTDATIGSGRAYVDGLLAEAFDGETVLGSPLSYLHQPFWPTPTPLPGGPGLFFLDVWTREVTWLEDPDLLEVALGDIDTTTRLQTVWQVKFVGGTGGPPPDCTTDLDALYPPSAGRLSTQAVLPPSPDDPCLLPESGGFRGVENRLYRVEIHDPKGAAAATFKWSRENASVATAVQRIVPNGTGSTLTVDRIGRDAVLRFNINDWIEVQDDNGELNGQAGVMAKVTDVKEADRTITVGVSLAMFDASDATRHTRIRRWDQQAGIAGTTGVIPVASAIGTWFTLEDGVQVQLSFDPAATVKEFHVGDSWSFAARTADASVEPLTAAAPLAIIHHYAPLATLLPSGPPLTDCRTLWPPPNVGCECVCVTAESHLNGTLTLQTAINKVITNGGGAVCVGPGQFQITTPLTITGAKGFTISGTGTASQIIYGGGGAAIAISGSTDVVVEMLSLDNRPEVVIDSNPVSAISIDFALRVRVEDCRLVARAASNRVLRGDGAGVLLTGLILDATVRGNFINATLGVATGAQDANGDGSKYLILARSEFSGNVIAAQSDGVLLDGFTLFRGRIAVNDNTVVGADEAAITILGAQLANNIRFSAGGITVAGNSIFAGNARGIVGGVSDLTVEDNEILGSFGGNDGGMVAGILLARSPLIDAVDRMVVVGNRVLGMSGDGISIDLAVGNLAVRNNIVQGCGGGIVMTVEAIAVAVAVEGNEVVQIRSPRGPALGIRLFNVLVSADVLRNTVGSVTAAIAGQNAVGIGAARCGLIRIRGNLVQDVLATPTNASVIWAGIAVVPLFVDVDVSDNTVTEQNLTAANLANAAVGYFGIVIVGAITNANNNANNLFAPAPAEFQVLNTGDANIAVFNNGDILAVAPARVERATMSGNVIGVNLDPGPIVLAVVQDDIGFNANRCFLTAGGAAPAAVILIAHTTIASSNRINGGDGKIDLSIGLANPNPPTLATVVGNIVHRQIWLNGVTLAAPWLPLNINA